MAVAAGAAEDLGFEAVWVHDFIVWTRKQDQTHVFAATRTDTEDQAAVAQPVACEPRSAARPRMRVSRSMPSSKPA